MTVPHPFPSLDPIDLIAPLPPRTTEVPKPAPELREFARVVLGNGPVEFQRRLDETLATISDAHATRGEFTLTTTGDWYTGVLFYRSGTDLFGPGVV